MECRKYKVKWKKTEDTDNFFYEIEEKKEKNMIKKCKIICCKIWDKIKILWDKWVNWIFKGFYK